MFLSYKNSCDWTQPSCLIPTKFPLARFFITSAKTLFPSEVTFTLLSLRGNIHSVQALESRCIIWGDITQCTIFCQWKVVSHSSKVSWNLSIPLVSLGNYFSSFTPHPFENISHPSPWHLLCQLLGLQQQHHTRDGPGSHQAHCLGHKYR